MPLTGFFTAFHPIKIPHIKQRHIINSISALAKEHRRYNRSIDDAEKDLQGELYDLRGGPLF